MFPLLHLRGQRPTKWLGFLNRVILFLPDVSKRQAQLARSSAEENLVTVLQSVAGICGPLICVYTALKIHSLLVPGSIPLQHSGTFGRNASPVSSAQCKPACLFYFIVL